MAEKQFGPYVLAHQIAVGGMAEIHLARAQGIAGFEKYVALKMIHPNFSQDQQFIQMLIDEAKITVQLQHVNIAQTFDLGRVDQTYYITMEYVDGADLYKLLRRSAEADREIPIPIAAFVAKEVVTGLDYAHRKRDVSGVPLGIVHRDVSPQNILISHAGEVKLVDFGIAKATMRARQTQVGVIKGKYYYMSPEQAQAEVVDHRTDVFSAGILLYEMLTGQMLYLEEDLHTLLEMVRRADIAPPTTLRKDVPPQLESIVMRALAKKADDRYRTAGDMATDLERFLHVYAPVFTATKVSAWVTELLGAPVPIGLPMPPPPEPIARHATGRFTREQLAHRRDDFIDEHSVIRRAVPSFDDSLTLDGVPLEPAAAPPRPAARGPNAIEPPTARPVALGPRKEATANRSQPRPTGGPLQAPPAERPPAGTSGLARPSPLAPRERPGAPDGARPLRPLPSLTRLTSGQAAASRPQTARSAQDETRMLSGAAPARTPAASPGKPGSAAPRSATAPAAAFVDAGDEATMISAAPGFDSAAQRTAQDETRVNLAVDDASEKPAAPDAALRDDRHDTDDADDADDTDDTGDVALDDVAARRAAEDAATAIRADDTATGLRRAPEDAANPNHERDETRTRLRGAAPYEDPLTGEETRVNLTAAPSSDDAAVDAAGSFDSYLPSEPDFMPGEPTMITGFAGLTAADESDALTQGGWESAPALAASVPKPAVSELRPPRQSRRTPPGGIAQPPSTTGGPTESSVLSAILSGEARGAQVAMPSQPTGPPLFARPDPQAGGAPAFAGPGFPSPPGHPGYPPQGYPGQSYPPPYGQPPAPLPLSYPVMAQPVYPMGNPVYPGPFPPSGGPFPPGPGSFTSQLQALEFEEIPDSYKIQPGRWLSPVRISLLALLLAGVTGGVLLGIYGGGDGSELQRSAVIEIVSSPPGASVMIDGKAQPERTPTKFVGEAGHKYLIALDLPRYVRWEKETAGSDAKLIARLTPVTVRLKVRSTPDDAEIFLNGAPTGRTPIELGGLDPLTTKVIEVRHRCCRPVRRVLEWGDRELEKTLDFPLER